MKARVKLNAKYDNWYGFVPSMEQYLGKVIEVDIDDDGGYVQRGEGWSYGANCLDFNFVDDDKHIDYSQLTDDALRKREEHKDANSKDQQISDLETVVEHLQNELTEWKDVARMLADELAEANSKVFPTSWEDASESSPAWIAYCNLRDRED